MKPARVMRAGLFLLLGMSIVEQLMKPPRQRTWHGKLFGFVPYDYRLPTFSRVKSAYWNTGSETLFTDRAIGLGWDVNLHRVWTLGRKLVGRS